MSQASWPNYPDVSTTELAIESGHAALWEVRGQRPGDEGAFAGRSALAARYLARREAGGPALLAATRGWQTKNTFKDGVSSLYLWGTDLHSAEVSNAVTSVQPADQRVLAALVAEQLRAAQRRWASPLFTILHTLHRSGWGESADLDVDGDMTSLQRITAENFNDYVAEAVQSSRVICADEGYAVATDGPTDRPLPWRGGRTALVTDARQILVGVQVVVASRWATEAALAVLAEAFGSGASGQGILPEQLRARLGLVYSTGVLPRKEHGAGTLVAYANTSVETAGQCMAALRRTVTETLTDGLDAARLRVAAESASTRILGELDGPFGAVIDTRRASRGEARLQDLARSAIEVAEEMAGQVIGGDGEPALAVVGDVPADVIHDW